MGRTIEYKHMEKVGDCYFLSTLPSVNLKRRASFKCPSCGNAFEATIQNVKNGFYKSCGCLRNERASKMNASHGLSTLNGKRRTEYSAYLSMLVRCYKTTDKHYKWHGARGIKVCDRWRESFENFIADMGFKPDPKLTLERVDNDGDYCPENCKWATMQEQNYNRRTSLKNRIL